MAHTYKREGSEFWSYEFYFSGKRYRKCTDQGDRDAALDIMAAHRTRLAKGERQRERVLTDAEVEAYLAACPQPWRDAATIMLGTGLRPSEVFSLRWERIHLNGSGGMLQISDGKSKAAKRMLPMVPRV